MLITVVCPRCDTTYHVQESLRGKPMRCLNASCRHVFIIETPSAAPAARTGQQSGTVGDLVPLMPIDPPQPQTPHVADMLEMLPAETAKVESGWMAPPPVRRQVPKADNPATPAPAPTPTPGTSRPRKTPMPAAEPPAEAGPRVVEVTGWDAPPPVRRDADPAAQSDTTIPRKSLPASTKKLRPEVAAPAEPTEEHRDSEPEHAHDEETAQPRRGHKARWVIIPFALLTFLGLGVGGYFVAVAIITREARLAEKADKFYEDGLFREAAQRYEELAKGYPNSEQIDRYQFRHDLAELRRQTVEPPPDITDILENFQTFLAEKAKDPLLPEHAGDIGSSLVKLLSGFAEVALASVTDDSAEKTLKQAEPIIKAVKAIKKPKDATGPAPEWAKVDASFGRLRAAIARYRQRQKILADLAEMAKEPSYEGIVRAEKFIQEKAAAFPDLPDDGKVKQIIDRLYQGHQKSVQYVRGPGAVAADVVGEGEQPAILFAPLLSGTPGTPRNNDPVALALVRGVLYALSATTGQMRWAVRVGIDTTTLPVRVPARAGTEESILVLSSDSATLSSLNTQGVTRWRYRLGTPVLGRPVVVDRRAYLPTYSGEVHEIELNGGKLLGRYLLGQHLTLGGTLEPGTRRVYFPADHGCIYILDVGKQECEKILYSRHPAGSLRSEPVVIPPESDDSSGYLVLTQTDGLDRVRLRVWETTGGDRTPREKTLDPKVEMDGWTWFSPYHDPEKIVLLSDAGVLGLVGIRQALNNDQALFPLLPDGGRDLTSLLYPNDPGRTRNRGRAEVAQMQGDELWVTAEGRMLRLRLAWGPSVGPRLVPAWPEPLDVGSPIHASQPFEDVFGRSSLIAVTQPAHRSCSWASRIDDATGKFLWKRQIGLVCPQPPVALARPGKDPVWLAMDQSAGLFALNPARYTVRPGAKWLSDNKMQVLADSLPDIGGQTPLILPSADGKIVDVLAFSGSALDLIVRQVDVGPGGEPRVRQGKVQLPYKLTGKPARVGDRLLLPLADGSLARLKLPVEETPDLETGLAWRAERAGTRAEGFVVALGPSRFITTDGARGLATWNWDPKSPTWDHLPPERRFDEPTLAMKDRIVGVTLVDQAEGLLAVADSARRLSLVEVKANGAMQIRRSWDLNGSITSGPFIRSTPAGVRIGCIVSSSPAHDDRSQLVWIDPGRDEVAWRFTTPGKDNIVGEPHMAGDVVVVADQSGRYIGLSVTTGERLGKGYRLRGSIAAVASPVLFQKDRLLAPLSDGTMMLLGIDQLRSKEKGK